MPTTEFKHYAGCNFRDPDNCSGCALTQGGEEGPNYSAWPIAYIENCRAIPYKWLEALKRELQSENKRYAENLKHQMETKGAALSMTTEEREELIDCIVNEMSDWDYETIVAFARSQYRESLRNLNNTKLTQAYFQECGNR